MLFVLLRFLQNANELGADYVVTPIELPDDIGAISLSLDTLPGLGAYVVVVKGRKRAKGWSLAGRVAGGLGGTSYFEERRLSEGFAGRAF